MTSQVRASYWALLGKEAGTKDDYGLLRESSSDRGGKTDRALPWSGIPSTPQLAGLPGPGQVPWVTFTPHQAQGRHWMAATAVDATAIRDAVGRQAVAIRYVEVPFADIARVRATCSGLYAGIPAIDVMRTSGPADPLDLGVSGEESTIRALADDAIFDRAASIAALLLGGEVMITLGEADTLPLGARLAEFDRVLALMPFGMRASVALASWQDGTQPTPFRLGFGRSPNRGQSTVPPEGVLDVRLGEAATAYRDELIAKRGRHGAARVVKHLASYGSPLLTDDAAMAHAILHDLDGPHVVLGAVRAGTASADRVANALDAASGRLTPRERDELDVWLLRAATGQLAQGRRDDRIAAAEVVEARWSSHMAGLAAKTTLTTLEETPDANSFGLRLLEYAGRHRDEDAFLSTVAAGKTRDGQDVPVETLADFLGQLSPAPGELPGTRRVLLANAALARALMRRSLARERSANAWVAWLSPADDDAAGWLRRYAVLAGQEPDESATFTHLPDIEASTEIAEDVTIILLLAVGSGTADQLPAAWWEALFRVAGASAAPLRPAAAAEPALVRAQADLRRLGSQPVADSAAPRDPITRARIDTLRLYQGQDLLYFPWRAGAQSCYRYLNALWTVWSQPPAEADVGRLASSLLEAVFDGGHRFGRPPVSSDSESAVTLLRALVLDDRVPLTDEVADSIRRVIEIAPDLASEPRLSTDWWRRVERLLPAGFRDSDVRLAATLRQATSEADPADIALLCGRAAVSGLLPPQLAALLEEWLARRPADRRAETVAAMLRVIEGVYRLSSPDGGPAHREYVAALSDLLIGPSEREQPRQRGLFKRWRPTSP